jgi:hypothetical protein
MEVKSNRRGGNVRNSKARGHVQRNKATRVAEAKTRQEAYSKLSLDEKIKRQEPYQGKQYRKLIAIKEKQK